MILKPPCLKNGELIGIFTPSFPAHTKFRSKYLHGIDVLKNLGFRVLEGSLTKKLIDEGYRSGTPQDRASEFMELIQNSEVKAIIAAIGGENSSSLIPYLNFKEIRENPKIICGYSDITALHMAILKFSKLSTFYGPAIVASFGEWPSVLPETLASFLEATRKHISGTRKLMCPMKWSHHFLDARTNAWKTETRKYEINEGWNVVREGNITAPIIIANLSTLLASAGTKYFPNLKGKILFIEEMNVTISREERSFRHLDFLGVFDQIVGLVVSKFENLDMQGSNTTIENLLIEIIGSQRNFPIVTQFDCGHTHPMLTLAQHAEVQLKASFLEGSSFIIKEPMVKP